MARLYNGIDGLGLGRSVNGLWNQQYLQRKQNMDSFANGMTQLMQGLGEQREQARQKQSAIDFLTRNGMTAADAQSLADSGLASGELTKYMQGRLDKKSDTDDERTYAEKIYGRNREDALSDRYEQWEHEFADWKRKNAITDAQAIRLAELGYLMNNRGIILSKDHGNSRAGKDALNENTRQIQSFFSKNPSLAFDIGLLPKGDQVEDEYKFYDEDISERLMELGDKSYTDAQREDYLKELQKANKLTYIQSNPELFRDALTIFSANADNKKLSPYLNLERVIGGTTTAPQRKREQDDAAFARKVSSIKNALEKESAKPWGEGKLPEGIDEKVKKELKKDKTAWSRYQKLGGS